MLFRSAPHWLRCFPVFGLSHSYHGFLSDARMLLPAHPPALHPPQLTDDFLERFGERWRQNTADSPAGDELCAAAVAKYQDPAAADKLLQIQRELDETKIVLHKTIDSVLARGEKLDNLVEKSSDLSLASQMFYKQARKTNSCCGMM